MQLGCHQFKKKTIPKRNCSFDPKQQSLLAAILFLLNQNLQFWLKRILFERQSVQWLCQEFLISTSSKDGMIISKTISSSVLSFPSIPSRWQRFPCLHALYLLVLDQPFLFDLHSIYLSPCDSKFGLRCVTSLICRVLEGTPFGFFYSWVFFTQMGSVKMNIAHTS